MRSSIFLSNVTVIDHAYVNEKGLIVGGSFNPTFIVAGEVDDKEKVVVDFSTIKHDIKAIIDDRETGLDHKLWIGQFSRVNSVEANVEEGTTTIQTDTFVTTMPTSAFAFLGTLGIRDSGETCEEYSTKVVGKIIEEMVLRGLEKKYPDVKISVRVVNTENLGLCFDGTPAVKFRYVHGLKDSTSYGCQNICHGHSSYVQIGFSAQNNERSTMLNHSITLLRSMIAEDLDNTIFVNEENVISNSDEFLEIGYTTDQRGTFVAVYDKSFYKIVILETETTVEYLAEYVLTTYRRALQDVGALRLAVSEGLNKGAVIDVPYYCSK